MLIHDLKTLWQLFKATVQAYTKSKAPRLGAALAYYTIFAVAPLFLVALSVAGFVFGEKAAHKELFGQINGLVGKDGAQAIESLIAAANRPKAGAWASIAALGTLAAGATAVFIELQDALNSVWEVKPKEGGGIRNFIKNRLLSFAMVLAVGFVLLVSLVLNAFLAGIGASPNLPHPQSTVVWGILNFLVSLGVITLLFAMIYKILPDIEISWSDVWVGAFVTALLFNLGKFLIGYYLGRGSLASIYGAAGSFIILLLWVYYSAQVLFLGAQFTRVYADWHSGRKNAVGGTNSLANPPSVLVKN
jgi:membrane protein